MYRRRAWLFSEMRSVGTGLVRESDRICEVRGSVIILVCSFISQYLSLRSVVGGDHSPTSCMLVASLYSYTVHLLWLSWIVLLSPCGLMLLVFKCNGVLVV